MKKEDGKRRLSKDGKTSVNMWLCYTATGQILGPPNSTSRPQDPEDRKTRLAKSKKKLNLCHSEPADFNFENADL
jgi:hypothetical protein